MSFLSMLGNKAKGAVGGILGQKFASAAGRLGQKVVSAIPGATGVASLIDAGAAKAGELASKALDTDIGKKITGGVKAAATAGDALTGGALDLKRKADAVESDIRSGKVFKRAALGVAGALL